MEHSNINNTTCGILNPCDNGSYQTQGVTFFTLHECLILHTVDVECGLVTHVHAAHTKWHVHRPG